MAFISKVPTGWRARWRTPEGAERSKTFTRKLDAERHLASVEHAKVAGTFVDPMLGRRLFGDWWTAWRSTRVDLRPSTAARDESYARNHILPRLGHLPLTRIDRALLRSWVADLQAKGLAPATIVKIAQLAHAALDAAVDERLIARNPASGLKLPRVESKEMRFLTPAEVTTLVEVIDDRYELWALTAAYSGLRFGELAGLRRSRIDVARSRLDVVETVVEVHGHLHIGAPKTRAGRRSVPIPRPVLDRLVDHVEALAPEDLAFTAPEGGPLRANQFRRRTWHPAVEAADVSPLRMHDLRHTAVSLWIAAGAGPKEIATWAGHTSVATVLDRYGHLLPGHEDETMRALTEMIDVATPTPGRPPG
jgi:integrase